MYSFIDSFIDSFTLSPYSVNHSSQALGRGKGVRTPPLTSTSSWTT